MRPVTPSVTQRTLSYSNRRTSFPTCSTYVKSPSPTNRRRPASSSHDIPAALIDCPNSFPRRISDRPETARTANRRTSFPTCSTFVKSHGPTNRRRPASSSHDIPPALIDCPNSLPRRTPDRQETARTANRRTSFPTCSTYVKSHGLTNRRRPASCGKDQRLRSTATPPWRRTSSLSTSRMWCRVATSTERRPASARHHTGSSHRTLELASTPNPRQAGNRSQCSLPAVLHNEVELFSIYAHGNRHRTLHPQPNVDPRCGIDRHIRQFPPGQLRIAGQDPLAGPNGLDCPGVVSLTRRPGHRLASERPHRRRMPCLRGTVGNTGSRGRRNRRQGNRTGPRLPQPARQSRHRQHKRHAPAKSPTEAGSRCTGRCVPRLC